VATEEECEEEHPKTGDFTAGECCDAASTRIDNPEGCVE
jgi:hypothetical protein